MSEFANTNLKKCRKCNIVKSKDEFVDTNGKKNPRGYSCLSCYNNRLEEIVTLQKESRESKIRKYKIVFGVFWEHYALPHDFSDELYEERDFCPYCGKKLPLRYNSYESLTQLRISVHIDHMDPLVKGGEDSIRNAVYVCSDCNLKKGDRLFTEWLDFLHPKYREISCEIYKQKHGHTPDEFKQGIESIRNTGMRWELCLEEEELIKMYPKPSVNGPPTNIETVIKIDVNKIIEKFKLKYPNLDNTKYKAD